MTFGDQIPAQGNHIRIKWREGEWLDYGVVIRIFPVGDDKSWLISSEQYVNSVVRYYDEWEMA